MSNVNQKYLHERVAADSNVAEAVVKRVIESYQDVVLRALVAGERIRVSNFLSMHVVESDARRARNPQNGESVIIPAQKNVRVTVSPHVIGLVRAGLLEVDGQLVTTRKLPKGAKGVIPVVTANPKERKPRIRDVKPRKKARASRTPR